MERSWNKKKNAPLSPERPPEMAPSSDGVASRAPSLGTFPGVSNWEGTGRRPRSHCWDCVSGGQECLRMPLAAMMSTGLVSREEMWIWIKWHTWSYAVLSNVPTCLGSLSYNIKIQTKFPLSRFFLHSSGFWFWFDIWNTNLQACLMCERYSRVAWLCYHQATFSGSNFPLVTATTFVLSSAQQDTNLAVAKAVKVL